jgi:hypothetical protein
VADRVLVFEGEVVGGGDGVGNGDHGAGLGGAAPSLARGGGDRRHPDPRSPRRYDNRRSHTSPKKARSNLRS